MKKTNLNIAAATAIVLGTMVGAVVAHERPKLAAEQCQPLTDANFDLCCIAQNRDDLLKPGELDRCPPNTNERTQKVLDATRASTGVNPDDGTVVVDTDGNNPGNLKHVGGAGEAPSDGTGEGFGPGNNDKGKSN